jgi:hypothetical protein
MTETLSPRVRAFLEEIEEVCRKHQLQLATSQYDGIDVWNLKDGETPIYSAGIEDKTGEK